MKDGLSPFLCLERLSKPPSTTPTMPASSHEEAMLLILAKVATAGDGAVIGLAAAYMGVRCLIRYVSESRALRRIAPAPEVRVSDLKALISADSEEGDKLVVVRGTVEAKRNLEDEDWRSMRSDLLFSRETGEAGVVLQRIQTCIYYEWRGILKCYTDLKTILCRSLKKPEITSLRTVPFALVESESWPQSKSSFVIVNIDGSKHQLPLTTVYHHLQPVAASPYSFLQALFGHDYPVGLLDEEKLLPLGKEVHAVGICCSKDGTLEIRSSEDLPLYLSEKNKDQIIADLTFRTAALFWGGLLLSSLSVGILGFAIYRNWSRWQLWRSMFRTRPVNTNHSTSDGVDVEADEEDEEAPQDVPDGALCVICLMRRRKCAFVPCGHHVCCNRCSTSIQHETSPKCPVCRQAIQHSVRIYGS